MMSPAPDGAHSLTPRQAQLMRALWAGHGLPFSQVLEDVGGTRESVLADMAQLFDIGIVEIDAEDRVQMVPPRTALADLLLSQTQVMEATMARLNLMGALVVTLGQEGERNRPSAATPPAAAGSARPADVELLHGSPPEGLVRSWIDERRGSLKFMRPEQVRLMDEGVLAAAFRDAASAGLSVECLYPVRSLVHGRAALDEHHEAGVHVRLAPEVPLQMGIVGDDRAMVVTGLGGEERNTLVIREPAVVAVLSRWFDSAWLQGVVMPGRDQSRDRMEDRRMLLSELARGARDEQIARSLGLGLRTVRRRVADLMIELGAETRFQAGIEAARRGWI